MLYAKMLPRDKSAGRTSRDYTILNPDTGEWSKFVAGDPEWAKVSDQFGEMLRKVRQHFWRVNSPPLFLIATEEEADRIDKEETVRRQMAGRKTRPRRSTARDLTVAEADRSPLERMSEIPSEPEADLVEIEQLQQTVLRQAEQIGKLTALVEKIATQNVEAMKSPSEPDPAEWPEVDPIPMSNPEPVGTPVVPSSSRATALGLEGAPAEDAEASDAVTLVDVRGIGDATAEALQSIGITSVQELVGADADIVSARLATVGMTPKKIRGWQKHGKELLG